MWLKWERLYFVVFQERGDYVGTCAIGGGHYDTSLSGAIEIFDDVISNFEK